MHLISAHPCVYSYAPVEAIFVSATYMFDIFPCVYYVTEVSSFTKLQVNEAD